MSEQQRFGGIWTVKKLKAVEDYLRFYTTALKNRSLKLCYIDAFSGSGNVELNDGQVIDGSAIRALRYPFDFYYFLEINEKHNNTLYDKVKASHPDKLDKIEIVNGDCNVFLQGINEIRNWHDSGWRGVIFLDPCAMQLSWTCLEKISETKAFDVWYFFPFSAVNRNLPISGEIQNANKDLLTKIFGTTEWEQNIYKESPQQSFFDDPNLEKIPVYGLKQYIINRLESTFPTVAPNPALLLNSNNSPIFLLCFAASNPGNAARGLALKGANHILEHM